MCDFDRLELLLKGKLPLDDELELFDHLDTCDVCFEEVYRIWKERDDKFHRPQMYLRISGDADQHG